MSQLEVEKDPINRTVNGLERNAGHTLGEVRVSQRDAYPFRLYIISSRLG